MTRNDKARTSASALPARRKQFLIEAPVLAALEAFSRDSGRSLDDLANEALRDLLKKLGRPLTLKDALRASSRAIPANDSELKRPKSPAKRYRPKA